jgi:hypothetical protein
VRPPPSPELRAKVTRTRANQGLPPVITDPATLERVASVLRLVAFPEPAPPRPRTRRRKTAQGPPEHDEPIG